MEPIQVNIHEAKTQLSRLIQSALSGREVIIKKKNRPLIRLEVLPGAGGGRQIGHAKGLIQSMAEDFDAPLEDFKAYME